MQKEDETFHKTHKAPHCTFKSAIHRNHPRTPDAMLFPMDDDAYVPQTEDKPKSKNREERPGPSSHPSK